MHNLNFYLSLFLNGNTKPVQCFAFNWGSIKVLLHRLEAELDDARRKHETQLRVELERQEAESRQRMAAELAKKTRQADEQLNEQRDLYEDRLAELNDLLVSLGFVKKRW